jgi:CheY-like chemotaxis protein
MDLSELVQAPSPLSNAPVQAPDAQQLVAQLGSEVAAILSSALERVVNLAATGRIDKPGLRALRDEIDLARRAGIMGQQVARLNNGHVQQAHEPLNLTALLRDALLQRGREIEARGIEVQQVLAPAEILSDETLLYSLLQTALDWSFEHAVSRIDFRLDMTQWPVHARLVVSFLHQPPDMVEETAAPLAPTEIPALNTMSWRLLQQTAAVLGLQCCRFDTAGRAQLHLQFPDTLAPRLPGMNVMEPADQVTQAHNSQPLAGRHVLVLAARREIRNVVREALRPMGLMIDFVGSVEEAQLLCSDGLPHAMVYDSTLAGDRFEVLRSQMLAEVPNIAFIRLADQGKAFEVLNVGGRQFASVGRDAIIESLPPALIFELSRHA